VSTRLAHMRLSLSLSLSLSLCVAPPFPALLLPSSSAVSTIRFTRRGTKNSQTERVHSALPHPSRLRAQRPCILVVLTCFFFALLFSSAPLFQHGYSAQRERSGCADIGQRHDLPRLRTGSVSHARHCQGTGTCSIAYICRAAPPVHVPRQRPCARRRHECPGNVGTRSERALALEAAAILIRVCFALVSLLFLEKSASKCSLFPR
jgi:hypothetical protein